MVLVLARYTAPEARRMEALSIPIEKLRAERLKLSSPDISSVALGVPAVRFPDATPWRILTFAFEGRLTVSVPPAPVMVENIVSVAETNVSVPTTKFEFTFRVWPAAIDIVWKLLVF